MIWSLPVAVLGQRMMTLQPRQLSLQSSITSNCNWEHVLWVLLSYVVCIAVRSVVVLVLFVDVVEIAYSAILSRLTTESSEHAGA